MTETSTGGLTPGGVRILEASGRLFYARGIHAVGVEAIAAEAGMTKRTLYDRFGSKEALVAAYLRRHHEQWWARMRERVDSAPGPKVLALFDAYLAAAEESHYGCPFLNAAAELRNGHLGLRVVADHKRQVREEVCRLIEAEVSAQGAAQLGEHVFLLLEGGIAHRGIDTGVDHLRAARTLAERLVADAVR
ncbi:TetR/AcrR family transcriptional regulator [Nesterenkonia marinintestina]|uniref:TetR/AcrR family transcriptional regulator n=1 Tax=Nesterenkonia marinintestina TaxID=2979865 RepID=UPI0021BEFFC7|nr:TetR/AcrR family transcriptional regulator [Nesterenkonia sp. GX14115]